MSCPSCKDSGVLKTKCCWPAHASDCCCAYTGGYDVQTCPDCPDEATTPDTAPAAA